MYKKNYLMLLISLCGVIILSVLNVSYPASAGG